MPTKVMQLKSLQGGRGFAVSGALAVTAAGRGLAGAAAGVVPVSQDQKLVVC